MRMRELLLLLLYCSGGCSPAPAPTGHPQLAKISLGQPGLPLRDVIILLGLRLRRARDTGVRLSITSSLDVLRERMAGERRGLQQLGRRATGRRPRRGRGETGNLVRIG